MRRVARGAIAAGEKVVAHRGRRKGDVIRESVGAVGASGTRRTSGSFYRLRGFDAKPKLAPSLSAHRVLEFVASSFTEHSRLLTSSKEDDR